MKMKKTTIFAVLALLLLAVPGVLADWAGNTPTGAGVYPVYRTDLQPNNECATLGYDYGFKVGTLAPDGTYTLTSADGTLLGGSPEDPGNSITISNSTGKIFDWSATLGIDAVVVKAGNGANVFTYAPEAEGDTGLYAPYSGSGSGDPGTIRDISHVTFCYDYEVDVSKDANTTFTRTYNWTIKKEVTPDAWDLFTGDSGTSQYTVSVDKTGYTDSDWAVNGTITIENNTPFDAVIESVSDVVSGVGSVAVDCGGVTFPYTLPSGGTLECTYSTSLPDGSSRTNTATVTTSGIVGGGEATADVTFGNPTTEVNKEINVTDTNGGSWGPVSDDASWTYSKTFTCDGDAGTHNNTATIQETGQSSGPVSVMVNCYALEVTKDADTSFTRTYHWTIDKSADQSALTLSLGQQFLVNYSVVVDLDKINHPPNGYVDSAWAVSGNIYVYNPAPMDATINSVADVLPGATNLNVNCGVAFPYTLPAGQTLQCSYSADLPDASGRTNTATATLQNYDYDHLENATPSGTTDFSGSKAFDFSSATITHVDKCIDVSDTYAGALGTVCYGVDTLPKTFTYSRLIGPYDVCGDYTVENTASFVTNDTGTTDSDSWTVNVHVPCVGGCTLTQGYWKTHSEYGPAPYDDTWAMLSNGADTPFFGTGLSYYEVLWTVPKGGNAYFILAHQYIAAKLNFLNGADPTAAQDAFYQAEALLIQYQGDLSIPKRGGDRALAIELYGLLDDYNNGFIGPGHCSE
jgi:hypothetical protein